MDTSIAWLNRYLTPGDVTADEADRVLTAAGFPIEGTEPLAPQGGMPDARLDVEVTSNRGDCLSHVGLAREVAASLSADKPRAFMPPSGDSKGNMPSRTGDVRDVVSLKNQTPELCPLFTVQLIRGVKVGPSPAWLAEALEAAGQRPINNVVDVTNFITLELGHPCHVFDLAKLAGSTLVVRHAAAKEKLTTLDGKTHDLAAADLVVADSEHAQSLAGVMGGADSEVGEGTVDVVLEMATWDPVTVREQGRRHTLRTDASYRFERIVAPAEIDSAAARAAALLVEVAGGSLMGGGDAGDGFIRAGKPIPAAHVVDFRPERCRSILGIHVSDQEMVDAFTRLEIDVQPDGERLRCTIPAFRPDLIREIDLVEEVARTKGYDAIPVEEKMAVRVGPPSDTERGIALAAGALTGMGFYETVTFSFVTPAEAELFVPAGARVVAVDDERRGEEPSLRPSVLPSLLRCRKANRSAGVTVPGGVRLFERAAIFGEDEHGASLERRVIALLMDVLSTGKKRAHDDAQAGLRRLAGVLEALGRSTAGPHARVRLEPIDPANTPASCWDPAACARIILTPDDITHGSADDLVLGTAGLIAPAVADRYDLGTRVAAAEVDERSLLAHFPPTTRIEPMPAFPGIERDVSLILGEDVAWSRVQAVANSVGADRLEAVNFVGVYRGEQVGAGKKSLTLRLGFRDPARTLRHEEVDPQVDAFVEAAKRDLAAEVRL